jgi:hypothetical protein
LASFISNLPAVGPVIVHFLLATWVLSRIRFFGTRFQLLNRFNNVLFYQIERVRQVHTSNDTVYLTSLAVLATRIEYSVISTNFNPSAPILWQSTSM